MVILSLKNWSHEIETGTPLYFEISPLITEAVFTLAPGCIKCPTKRPIISARVVTTSK